MKEIIFYKCLENDLQNDKIKEGESYAVYPEDQEISGLDDNEVIIRNFGLTKKEYLEKHKNICKKCNRPNNGVLPRDKHNGTGFYVCLCDWSF